MPTDCFSAVKINIFPVGWQTELGKRFLKSHSQNAEPHLSAYFHFGVKGSLSPSSVVYSSSEFSFDWITMYVIVSSEELQIPRLP